MHTGPLFFQFAERLKRQIAQGEYPVGTYLPSIARLTEMHKLSRNTVMASLRVLADDGLIRRGEASRHGYAVVKEPELQPSDRQATEKGVVKFSMPFSFWHYVGNKLFDGIESRFASEDIRLVFRNNKNTVEDEGALLDSVLAGGRASADVLILMSGCSYGNPNVPRLLELQKQVPVILLDREVIGFYSHYIGVDNVDIGYRAALHLIARGHKRVGFAYTAGQISTDRGRLSGYRMAVEEAGLRGVEITIRENIHRSLESFKSSSRLFGDQIQQIADRPTAWVCSSDKEAVALMDHFGSAGLAVPADVAVVGCDHDLFLLHDKHYELTTFEYPYAQIAREILFLYSSLLRDEQVPFRKTEFRAELVPGQTS